MKFFGLFIHVKMVAVTYIAFFCLGLFFGCGNVSPYCVGNFSIGGWPSHPSVIDIADVNATLMEYSSNYTITYAGRPFFLRFRNISGVSAVSATPSFSLELPPKTEAIYLSLFSDFKDKDLISYFALRGIRIPQIFYSRFHIREVVLYLERFYADSGFIFTPIIHTYTILIDYGND